MKYFILSVLFVILGALNLLNPMRIVFQKGLTPVQLGLSDVAGDVKGGFIFMTNIAEVRQRNLELLEKATSLESELLELKKLSIENEALKSQLNLKNTKSFDRELLLSGVLGNIEDLSYSTFYIDKGFKHGVSVNDMVILGNSLVGKVREVTYERSLVDYVTSPNFTATVFDIDSYAKTQGICNGKFGLYIEMTRIFQSEGIDVGDTIVTSGKDGIFLSGFSVGRVVSVEEMPADPLKSAQLEPAVDLKNLSKVFVVLSK